MRFQPVSDFLFRTEEIVDPSAASEKNSGRVRIQFFDFAILESQMDPLAAVLGSVFHRYFLIAPFPVDQQDKI